MLLDGDNSSNYFEPELDNFTYLLTNYSADGPSQVRIPVPISREFSAYVRITASVACSLILIFGGIGNILVATTIWKTKELRNSMNLFLVNLSLADLLILLVCVPPVLVELHSDPYFWMLGKGLCKAIPYAQLTAAHVSVLTILSISFERYYAICKPLKAGYKCTQMRAISIIVVIWLVAVLSTLPVLLTIHYYAAKDLLTEDPRPICYMRVEQLWEKLYYLLAISVFYALPFLILLAVCCHIRRHLMKSNKMLERSNEATQMRSRKQVVIMLVAVIVSFFLCLLPFRVFTIWLIFSSQEDIINLGMETSYTLMYICRLLIYINAALNPIIYSAISSKFRNFFFRLLGCSSLRNRLTR
ncbi:Orexin receptor type 2 like protein [Argiope bruennichi]|uniref:Orexin receptor type 2 like protein n=1 Tax=Argiope bruennichi TaxID=94029 RepID=A0A8T0EBY5_ARGBR|nr:Orexin receptor type 2 like protein [Argiope bruennichi]